MDKMPFLSFVGACHHSHIVGHSEFPACSYECVIEIPGFENNVDKITDWKKVTLNRNND
jgi:hypothetical protein